jgi:diguanylate cyclase (GGDEF)-like protein
MRIDRLAKLEGLRPLREFFLYRRSEPDSTAPLTLAEPLLPASDATNPAARLERCLRQQEQALVLLERGLHPVLRSTQALTLLRDAMTHETTALHECHALQTERDALRDERDQLAAALRLAEALSLTDELTGLPNRRALMQRLDQELSRHQRSSQPLALVLLDIDHFKDINDQHGHYVGDMILRHYAESMFRELRQHDLLARYGGEEFALLLPETRLDEARNVADKLARRLRHEPLEAGDVCLPLPTFSAGITGLRANETALSLINRADQALYRAKRQGRNCIETSEPL